MSWIGFFCVIFVIATIIYWILGSLWIALCAAILLSLVWMYLAFQTRTNEIITNNLTAYFSARKHGMSHSDSLKHVVETCHDFSNEINQLATLSYLDSQLNPKKSEEQETIGLIYFIFSVEGGSAASRKSKSKVISNIKEMYKTFDNAYS
jgi:hypothetical protein